MKITEKELSTKEKNKIRCRTIIFLQRYCNIKKECQVCGTTDNVQIHHQNYNDYLKINLLCRKHHYDVHNDLIQAPKIINLSEKTKVNIKIHKKKLIYNKWYENPKWDSLPNKEIVLKRILEENN